MRRPRSYSNLLSDDRESPVSIPRSDSSPSISGDINSGIKAQSAPEISILHVDDDATVYKSESDLSLNLGDGKVSHEELAHSSFEASSTPAENQFRELDPFLSAQTTSDSTENLKSSQTVEYFKNEEDQGLANEGVSFFQDISVESPQTQVPEVASVEEMVTSSSAPVSGSMTSLPSPSIQQGWNSEELIYF